MRDALLKKPMNWILIPPQRSMVWPRCRWATGDNEQAIEYALEAVGIAHYFPRAHFHLAQALFNIGRREEAIAAAQLCVTQAPSYVPAREMLVKLHEQMGRSDLAAPHQLYLDSRLLIPPSLRQ
ncbi:MAG: hypothetical protein WDM76_01515 [Limisphaerales bacterium]